MASFSAAAVARSVDPLVWKACAGSCVHVPAVDSLVYYFPQGHAEQVSTAVDLSPSVCGGKPCSLCRVVAVQLLANQETDEVYAKMELDPRIPHPAAGAPHPDAGSAAEVGGAVSFAKVLTPSDANNGGGFSVPRFCADAIFPALDYGAEPPVQNLVVSDVHGVEWDFRHIYRGTPRRHLLTTGWSKFVNSKKLVAGDSVVFIKKRTGELFVGVRRTGRSAGPLDFLHYSPQIASPAAGKLGDGLGIGDGFSRKCRGKVSPEAIVEAVRLAGLDHPFEVTYYPRMGFPDFVVRKDVVESAVHLRWLSGTRVKMAVETEDSSRMTSFQGTVTCVVRHPALFTYSPWRTLEVAWDEPDAMHNVKRVSPWQVELVSVSPQMLNPYPAIKKPRITQNQEFLADAAEENVVLKLSGFSNKMMGNINLSVFNRNAFPVGIQGARHDPICVSSISSVPPKVTHQMLLDKINGNITLQRANHVSPEMNIGRASQSDGLSPSQSNIHCHLSNLAGSAPSKVINGSFQLFGKIIQMEQPVVADVKEGCKDDNISFAQKQFCDGHDGQFKGISPVET
ncbi:hypothetical protein Taro_011836 [Colocasia esculenta]|uniref:Auxin response factor n=1 Tax=Colocasia esculenta TaxID=4460 RepID=A0A843UHC0_COLES|nr:hypothetical protein [Colocasia esculenta]